MKDEEQEGGHASWPIVWNVWCKCLESGLRLTVFPVGSSEIFVQVGPDDAESAYYTLVIVTVRSKPIKGSSGIRIQSLDLSLLPRARSRTYTLSI